MVLMSPLLTSMLAAHDVNFSLSCMPLFFDGVTDDKKIPSFLDVNNARNFSQRRLLEFVNTLLGYPCQFGREKSVATNPSKTTLFFHKKSDDETARFIAQQGEVGK